MQNNVQKSITTIENCISLLELTNANVPNYKLYVDFLFTVLADHYHVLQENKTFSALIKALFHNYIVEKQHYNLIKIYNQIFTDGYYNTNNQQVFYPTITLEWMYEQIKQYNEQIKQYNEQIKQHNEQTTNNTGPINSKYAINEIIGAKDKNNMWWMSKVLTVALYNSRILYYVEFLRWGEKYNEFIFESSKLEKFNPRKHRYFNPVWKKYKNENSESKECIVDMIDKYDNDNFIS